MGDSVSMNVTDDNISDDFFELTIEDVKRLHSENVKKVREAEEGDQVCALNVNYIHQPLLYIAPLAIIATTPPINMYGYSSSLQKKCVMHEQRVVSSTYSTITEGVSYEFSFQVLIVLYCKGHFQ